MITTKQNQEIEFLCNFMGDKFTPTENEKKDYILKTVKGVYVENNPIVERKRKYEIMYKYWIQDLNEGIISKKELYLSFNSPFFRRNFLSKLK